MKKAVKNNFTKKRPVFHSFVVNHGTILIQISHGTKMFSMFMSKSATEKRCFSMFIKPSANVAYCLKVYLKILDVINTFQPSFTYYIETNHLILGVNQITGFCMKSYTGMKWVNKQPKNIIYAMIYRPYNGNIKTLTQVHYLKHGLLLNKPTYQRRI